MVINGMFAYFKVQFFILDFWSTNGIPSDNQVDTFWIQIVYIAWTTRRRIVDGNVLFVLEF